jgi:hypothetical protein
LVNFSSKYVNSKKKFRRSRNTTSALGFGGYTTSITAATEEFTITGTKTLKQ